MVSAKTVLIVGAGGSMPFRYPSGSELVSQIVDGIRFGRRGNQIEPLLQLARQMLDAGCNPEMCQAFSAQLNESQCYSVDAFLERHSEFLEVGKIAIASALLPKEVPESLFAQNDNWYRYLANKLGNNISSGLDQPLTILTYNYDRSLEYYLYRSLKTALNFSEQQMAELMSRLKVIHLHGSLGILPWQQLANGVTPRDYGNHAISRTAADQIKIIHENVDDSPAYEEARNHLSEARRVCFLGFGFHPTNVRRLHIGGWLRNDLLTGHIHGTCLGLRDGEKSQAIELLEQRIHLTDLDCHQFLRQHVRMIS